MGGILAIVFVVLLVFIGRTYLRARAEQKLRDDYPPRRVIEVTIPGGINDSRVAMARFWRKVASATTSDPKVRKTGIGQIDFVYMGVVPKPKAMPRVSCFIYADPDKMDAVKRALKSTYEDLEIVEHKEDPLSPVAEGLKPKAKLEPEQMEAGAGA
jgi:hypothetical protein